MSDINVSMDAGSVIIAVEAVTKSFAAMTAGIASASLESAKYGNAGEFLSGKIRGIDTEGKKFTATVKEVQGQLNITSIGFNKLGRDVDVAKTNVSNLSKSMNDLFGMFQRFVGYKALNSLTDGLKDGFNAAKDFQIQISLIRTISQDNQLSFNNWAQNLRQVSDELGTGIVETSKAAYDAVSNQVAKGSAVIPFLKNAGDLARTTGGSLEQAGNTLASVINAYGKSASDAQNISATLFATIDEGRVVLSELASGIGPVNILAKGLGVSFEEVGASIAFLTQKGVQSDVALTFLRNVFVQLEKPSEALTAFFRSLGVESGRAAVATYGYLGVLQKIKDAVGNGNTEVAKLFPEIRAQQPIQAALNDFAGFERITNKFQDTAAKLQNYQKAINIRAESPADFINKEFNKLKNSFVGDIGQSLTKLVQEILVGLGKINSFFGGGNSLAEGLNYLVIKVRDITVAIIAFRTASAASTAITAAWTAATSAAGIGATRTAVAVQLLNTSMKATVVGLVAAGIAIAATKLFFTNDVITDASAGFNHLNEDLKKYRDQIAKTNATKLIQPFENFSKTIDKSFDAPLKGIANVTIAAQANLANIKQINKEAQDAFANSFQTYTDSLKNKINELKKNVTEAESVIKDSFKAVQDFARASNKAVDDFRLGNLAPQQKVSFLDQQIAALTERATALYKTGTKDNLQEAERLFSQIIAAEVQKTQAQVDAFKAANPTADDQTIKNYALSISGTGVEQLEGRLAQLTANRVQLQKDLNTAKKEEIKIANEQIEKQTLASRNLQDAFKAVNEFSPYDAAGGVKKEFRNDKGGLDLNKARQGFTNVSDNLSKALDATKGDPRTSSKEELAATISIQNTIAAIKRTKLDEIFAAEKAQRIQSLQDSLLSQKKESQEKLALNATDLAKLAEQEKGYLDKADLNRKSLSKLVDPASGYVRGARIAGIDIYDKPFGSESKQRYADTKANQKEAQEAIDQYNTALAKTKNEMIEINGVSIANPKNVKALDEARLNVETKIRKLYRPLLGDLSNRAIPGNEEGLTFDELFGTLRSGSSGLLQNSQNLGANLAENLNLQDNFKSQIEPSLKELGGQLDSSSFKELTRNATTAATGLSSLQTPLEQFKSSINGISDLLRSIPVPNARSSNKGPEGPVSYYPTTDSDVAYLASGGWVGAPPRGTDRKRIMGSEGEFMVNSESAEMFPDTLEAINKTRRGSSGNILGGNVSNQRIGDIYITVNEAKDGQASSRQIWNKLKREFKRGTIS